MSWHLPVGPALRHGRSMTAATHPHKPPPPIVVVEEPEPEVEEGAASSKGLLPWLILPLVACVVFCGAEDE